jgi:DNA-binding NtrC family response regulator
MTKVLIIDDDLDILETIGALLQDRGFEIHSADTVEDGLKAIPEISPDLVLLDVLFPEDSHLGFKTTRIIKERFPGLTIFLLSAVNREYAFNGNEEKVEADEFLIKPVNIDRLVRLINQHVK